MSLAAAQWALTATLLVGAVSTPILGRLGGGAARRPVIVGGLAVVLLGTVLSALPLGYGGLVTGRALQGIGLALVPLAIAVARDAFRGSELRSVSVSKRSVYLPASSTLNVNCQLSGRSGTGLLSMSVVFPSKVMSAFLTCSRLVRPTSVTFVPR